MSEARGDGVFLARLRDLLGQDREAVLRRERQLFSAQVPAGAPLVLFGAGGLGRKALAGLRAAGVEPAAFSDNDPRLHGTSLAGVAVLPPAVAAARYGETGVFVVTVFLGAAPLLRQLAALGCRTVLPFYPLFWRYPERLLPHYAYDLPHRVIDARQEVLAAAELFGDPESQREFLDQVRWRLDPDCGGLAAPTETEIYFPPDLVALGSSEVFVDCGGYDGDTVRSFLTKTGGRFERAVVFEPDPGNFANLAAALEKLPAATAARIEVHQAAVGERAGTVRFDERSSASAVSGEGGTEVRTATLDEVLGERPSTFIKMDIEGAELDALAGGSAHIRRFRPLLAISAYHRHDHLWRIPRLIHTLDGGYRCFLRRHSPEIVDDLVLYAIPAGRALPGPGARSAR